MSIDTPTQRENGLDPEGRYEVRKINDPTGKHDECAYFVLDPQHDPGARFALRAYKVWASRNGYEALADDLDRWLSEVVGLLGSAADTPTPEAICDQRHVHGRCEVCVLLPEESPTPEPVTLTAAEGEVLRRALTSVSPMSNAPATVERILAAREQALREEIAREIEAYADRREKTGAGEWDNEKAEGMSRGRVNGLDAAARIARGGAR